MSNDLISREALIDDIDAAMENAGMGQVIGQTLKRYVKRQPAVDAVEVVHAKWKLSCNNGVYEQGCTNCGFFPGIKFWSSDYCPNCGARMDGE